MPYKIRVTGLLREGQWSPDVTSPDPADVLAVLDHPKHHGTWGRVERRIAVTELMERHSENATLDNETMVVSWPDDEVPGGFMDYPVENLLPGWEWTSYDGTLHPIRYDEATDELVSDAQHTAMVEDVTDENEQRQKAQAKREILNDPELLDDLLDLLPAAKRQKYRDRIDAPPAGAVIGGPQRGPR